MDIVLGIVYVRHDILARMLRKSYSYRFLEMLEDEDVLW